MHGLCRNCAVQRIFYTHFILYISTVHKMCNTARVETNHSGKGSFGIKKVALLGHSLSSVLVTLEGSCHLLIVYPLVAYKLQHVTAFGSLQILVGSFDEFVGQLVLLLQGGVSQRGVDCGLFQICTLFSAEGVVKILT